MEATAGVLELILRGIEPVSRRRGISRIRRLELIAELARDGHTLAAGRAEEIADCLDIDVGLVRPWLDSLCLAG